MAAPWLRIAHRGACGTAPEHTRAAFERALALGVDMIEMDAQLTCDDEIVVFHDFELQRTTNGDGPVRQHTLAAIKRLDAGAWFGQAFAGERVLTLDEVLDLVGVRARLNVEVKSPAAADWAVIGRKLIATLHDRGRLEETVVSCFMAGALAALREQSRAVRLGFLWQQEDLAMVWRLARELSLLSVHPHWSLVTPSFVEAAHVRGLRVLTWTVNDAGAMARLVQVGVDGIISDYPERVAQVPERPEAGG